MNSIDPSKRTQVANLLTFSLADGDWHPSRDIARRICDAVGCHVRTVFRVRNDLGIESQRVYGKNATDVQTLWRLSIPGPEADHDRHDA